MALEQLWAGWRNEYVVSATTAEREGASESCVFCRIAASGPPSVENGVLFRGETCFCVLNAYPYGSGHLLVLPLRHLSGLDQLTDDESEELWTTTRAATRAIENAYAPDGINIGANLGRAAGAGIPAHLHLHALPRWSGDTNFMTAIGETRVIPESLGTAWEKLTAAWG